MNDEVRGLLSGKANVDNDHALGRSRRSIFVGTGLMVLMVLLFAALSGDSPSASSETNNFAPAVADDGLSWTSVTLKHIEEDPHRVLLHIELTEPARVAVAYAPVVATGRRRVSPSPAVSDFLNQRHIISKLTDESSTTHDIIIHRLRSSFVYDFVILADNEAAEDVVRSFTTRTSVAGIESNLCVDYDSTQGASWEILLFNVEKDEAYSGLVAIDDECYVVWYNTVTTAGWAVITIDQLPDGTVAFMEGEGRVGYRFTAVNADHEEVWYHDYQQWESCLFGQEPGWHHELSYDRLDSDVMLFLDVETIMVEEVTDDGTPIGLVADILKTYTISTGQEFDLYHTAEYFPWEEIYDVSMTTPCGTPDGVHVGDWSHLNTFRTGADDNYVISSRSLCAVMSFARDGSGMEWQLGGTHTDFNLTDPDDEFCGQHGVWQLDNGNILMMDNQGYEEVEKRNSSRGVEFMLDFDTMMATKVWMYEPEPLYHMYCCGDIHLLESGNRLLVFGGYSSVNYDGNLIVEADEEENTVSWWEIKPDDRFLYRAVPASGLGGESLVL